MPEIVDARDVLDANARTRRAFRGRIIGRFDRTGPNRWDPYRFVPDPGGTIDVLPGLRIHVESEGLVFRMRSLGKVVRVEWLPTDEDRVACVRSGSRRAFLDHCVERFRHRRGRGAAAVIARKIERRRCLWS